MLFPHWFNKTLCSCTLKHDCDTIYSVTTISTTIVFSLHSLRKNTPILDCHRPFPSTHPFQLCIPFRNTLCEDLVLLHDSQQTRSSFGVVRTYNPSYNPKTGELYFVCPDNYKKNSFQRLNFPKVSWVDRGVENTVQVKSPKVAIVLEWGLRSPYCRHPERIKRLKNNLLPLRLVESEILQTYCIGSYQYCQGLCYQDWS